MSGIKLNNICLDYIVKTGTPSLKKFFLSLFSKEKRKKSFNSSYRALNNISLELNEGDRLGILGRNGAGKSTLLGVLAKVYKPVEGDIEVSGKISTLFNLNIGVDMEASGYENIISLGIVRHMRKREIEAKIPDVEEFTELGEFLHAPVRTYSSGMLMKLAFAVGTCAEPDILLIDEIIGAGDYHFMDKAKARISKMIDQSKIMVLTTHGDDLIKEFCNKAIVLENGTIAFSGAPQEAIAYYHRENQGD